MDLKVLKVLKVLKISKVLIPGASRTPLKDPGGLLEARRPLELKLLKLSNTEASRSL